MEDLRVEVDLGVDSPAHQLRQNLAVDVEVGGGGRWLEGLRLAEVVALGHEPHAEPPGGAGLEPPAGALDGVGDPGVVDLLDGHVERELGRVEEPDDDRLEVVGRAIPWGPRNTWSWPFRKSIDVLPIVASPGEASRPTSLVLARR